MENMGTRETQDALPKGVCEIKLMNGKILQTAFRESDQFVVLLKQGNACGGKGLTIEPLYSEKDGEVLLKSRMREIFKSGSVRGLIV